MHSVTHLRIDRAAIRHNLGLMRAHVGAHTQVMAVVKANAYGHGAIEVAQTALAAGANWLGVAQLHEALALRDAGIDANILVMGYIRPADLHVAVARDVSFALFDEDVARAASKAAQALQKPARAHVKVDTGMGRLGVLPDDAAAFVHAIAALPGVKLEGLYTHFACADCDAEYTQLQIAAYAKVRRETTSLRAAHGTLCHACNSAGAMAFPTAHFDMVRMGVALYGMNPFAPAALPAAFANLQPVLSFCTRIAQIKTPPAGSGISYGATVRSHPGQRIAVIPVGYGDGFWRAPRNFGGVLVRGVRCPIIGRVCMDNSMIDVTHVPDVQVDDEVVIIGAQVGASITVEAVAEQVGSINYDISTSLAARPDRVYIG